MKNAFLYQTPIGKLVVAENGTAITNIFFYQNTLPNDLIVNETLLLKQAGNQIKEYFAGRLKTFDLPLDPKGTGFQKSVWNALRQIPYGETRSYLQIAQVVGNQKAYRAVGMANNKNPLMIVVPCHRVIGTNGDLVGYAGGLTIKNQLLQLEKQYRSLEV